MKFDTVNEMLEFSKTIARTPSGKIPKAHVFRIAYVDLCMRKGFRVSKFATRIGVKPTTPYSWVPMYKQWLEKDEPEEVQLAVAETEYEKVLGKISDVSFGIDESRMGLHLSFSMTGSGVSTSECFWDYSMKRSEYALWTEADRDQLAVDTLKLLSKTLLDAQVQTVDQLLNKPVELTLNRNILKSWRILTEVL